MAKTRRTLNIKSHPQNRPFIALGQVATSYDLGASQFLYHAQSINEWE